MTKTPFAVATQAQAEQLLLVKEGRWPDVETWSRAWGACRAYGWVEGELHEVRLTEAGHLAGTLREILGPDRGLTRAGAKALMKGAPTRATKIRLMDDGLWKRQYVLGSGLDSRLTEDGHRVRELLLKYDADL
jgi:hypothetical protein